MHTSLSPGLPHLPNESGADAMYPFSAEWMANGSWLVEQTLSPAFPFIQCWTGPQSWRERTAVCEQTTLFFPLRAQIPRNNKLEPELKLHSPQILEEEKVLDISSLVFWSYFFPPRDVSRYFFLSLFYNYSCGTSITGLSCLKIGLRVRSSSSGAFPPSSIRAPPWIYFVFILGRMHA